MAVKNFNLTIEEGTLYGIVGTSGAGKSTLIRTLNLLERPSSGSIYVDGQDISSLGGKKLQQYRRTTGMVFQHFNLIKRKTVRENILFALNAGEAFKTKEEKETRITELLNLVGLSDKADSYPAQLSGGQQQRVGIARGLANNPKLLLCDEPTSALDAETTESILNLLKSIHRQLNITILIITHELDILKKICTHGAVMDQGLLRESDTVYNLFAKAKDPYTKSLVAHSFQMDEKFPISEDQVLIKLIYRDAEANEPSFAEAAKKYSVQMNIIHGKIDYIADKPLGMLKIMLMGSEEEMVKCIRYFLETVNEVILESNNPLSLSLKSSLQGALYNE